MSLWEKYEAALAFLFSSFLGPLPLSEPSRRAFFAVRTFEGRAEMLKAASQAYFSRPKCAPLQAKFKESVISKAKCYSLRRNDIAHGYVDSFATQEDWKLDGHSNKYGTFALYPSIASFKERDLLGIPSYCMVSADISHFSDRVTELQPIAIRIADEIVNYGLRSSPGKPPRHGP
jgi:hypothetical protein